MRRQAGLWMLAVGMLVAGGASGAVEGTGGGADQSKSDCRDSGVTIRFAPKSSELDSNARGALNGLATWLKMKDGRTIRLHTETANKRLADERAAAMKNYLMGRGIEPEQILTAAAVETGSRPAPSRPSVAVLTCDSNEAAAAR
jgi:outer membrane protein OmpA-like peptidoglycan-associated protein